MSKFDDFVSEVFKGVKDLATGDLKDLQNAAKEDADAFITLGKADLRKWTHELAEGKLSQEEFSDLVAGQADLAKLFALAQAGIATARLQRFRDALIKLVIDKAFDTFLP